MRLKGIGRVVAFVFLGVVVACLAIIVVAIVFGGGLGDSCPPYCG